MAENFPGGVAPVADRQASPRTADPKLDDAPQVNRRRIVAATMVGTTIEFFDFYICATAAVLVFPALFFHQGDATAALLKSFATFGLAFAARPLGSIVFGHLGDRIGRKGRWWGLCSRWGSRPS